MNLSIESSGLAYTIVDGVVQWADEPVDMTADELESLELSSDKTKGAARQKAKEFLEVTLASGWLPSKELFETADRMGIKQKTLRRALKDMGCRKRKDGMEGGFSWALSDC
jgi:predicted DNA-binding protein (UPF0251 family)